MTAFNFTSLEDIRPALLKLRRPLRPIHEDMATNHLGILYDLAQDLVVCSTGLLNARRLAKGYEDLVVVLIEPTDKAERVPYSEMLAALPTLRYVNETLQFASGGVRDIGKTIILDVRAFRSNSIRTSQGLDDQIREDELAYSAFEKIMSRLHPRVVVVCQCATYKANNNFLRDICSSIEEAGDVYLQRLPTDHKCLFVKSFHPMYYERSEDCSLKMVMREYLFDATFIIALNALAGDRISGMGVKNLRQCAQYRPAVIFTPEGVYITYQCVSGGHYASESLLEFLLSIKRPLDDIDHVLARYKETEWSCSLSDLSLKRDILEELGGNSKPLPPNQPLSYY